MINSVRPKANLELGKDFRLRDATSAIKGLAVRLVRASGDSESSKQQVTAAECPECSSKINVPNDSVDGELFTCNECGSDLELEKPDKGEIKLKLAESVKEDWGE